jgi:hypothetical protein
MTWLKTGPIERFADLNNSCRNLHGCNQRSEGKREMNPDSSAKRKMSEMILKMATDFINVGKTPEEKQNRLNAVCYAWETIEAENPELWNELKSNDINAMIDELVRYKKTHFPDDRRRILSCGFIDGKIRVHWLKAAAPGVDSKWEMRLYGLVHSGRKEDAIRFLQETLHLSRRDATGKVVAVAFELGIV